MCRGCNRGNARRRINRKGGSLATSSWRWAGPNRDAFVASRKLKLEYKPLHLHIKLFLTLVQPTNVLFKATSNAHTDS